jgi:hypothetical protein
MKEDVEGAARDENSIHTAPKDFENRGQTQTSDGSEFQPFFRRTPAHWAHRKRFQSTGTRRKLAVSRQATAGSRRSGGSTWRSRGRYRLPGFAPRQARQHPGRCSIRWRVLPMA